MATLVPTPAPNVAVGPPPYEWIEGSIEGGKGDTQFTDAFALPDAVVAVERQLDYEGAFLGFFRSEDGVTWTPAPSPSDRFVFEFGAVIDDELTVIGYSGNAERPKRQLWTTTDGLAWNRIEQRKPMRFGHGFFTSLTRAEAGWIAEGRERIDADSIRSEVYFSPDRSEWRRIEPPFGPIASNGSVWATVGFEVRDMDEVPRPNVAWVSADAETWTKHEFPATAKYDSVITMAGTSEGFSVGGQHFVVETEASQPLGWWSQDGTDWQDATYLSLEGPAGEAAPRNVNTSSSGLISRGNGDPLFDAIWTSPDGRAWTQVTQLPSADMQGGGFALWGDKVIVFAVEPYEPPRVWLGTAN